MSDFDDLLTQYNGTFPSSLADHERFAKIPRQLPGLASFPVSTGMYDDATMLPKHGAMFIGHNPDSKGEFDKRALKNRAHGEPPKMKFWQGLDDFFVEVEIPRRERFFTNVYPALEVLKSSRRIDSPFALWCHQFLKRQIDLMIPRVLIVFGDDALPHVEKMALPIATVYISHPSYWIKLISLKGQRASDERISREAKRVNEALRK